MCNAIKNALSDFEDSAKGVLRGIDDFTVGNLTGDFSRADDGRKEFESSFEDAAQYLAPVVGGPLAAPLTGSKGETFLRELDDDGVAIINPITDKLTNASGQAANAEKIANATIAAGEAQTAAQLAAMNAAARAAADAARLAAERDKAAKAAKPQELAAPDVAIDDPNSANSAGAIRRRRAVFGRNYATGVRI
jgi:hypothetical protein